MRGKVRRPRARPAAALPGRHGAPPPVTTSRREELADGEAFASRKARPMPRNRRAGAPQGAPPAKGGNYGRPVRQAALRPPRFFETKRGLQWKNARAREKRGREDDGVWPMRQPRPESLTQKETNEIKLSHLAPSCPALCRASTPLLQRQQKDVDGRNKPCHDEKRFIFRRLESP